MKATEPDTSIPGAHVDQPFRDCAHCYGATYGAALTTVIEAHQEAGISVTSDVLHGQAAAAITNGTTPAVLCPAHDHIPEPRWTRDHIEYARATEALHGRRVVGVVVDDDTVLDGTFDCTTSETLAACGDRVIIVSDCCCDLGHDRLEDIQRRCDTRYRIKVPR